MTHDKTSDFSLALVLSGGNALGAYQAGVYQALHEHALEPEWVAGASIGSINGAVICGNPADRRIARLTELWAPAAEGPSAMFDDARRTGAAAWTLAGGRPDLFVPRNLFGPWWNPLGTPGPASLYDATPLIASLERLVDFDLLNRGAPRYSATAVDVDSGEDIVFDTHTHRIDTSHIRASSALLPTFAPIDIDGRLLGDAGISANLPLDGVLSELPERPLLCIAVDLLPLRGARPATLGDTVSRMQDLMFATQSRRAIAAWQAIFDERARQGTAPSVTILHISYTDQAREVSGKAFDFSAESVAARWQSGHDDMAAALAQLKDAPPPGARPGLTLYARDRSALWEETRWPMQPIPSRPA